MTTSFGVEARPAPDGVLLAMSGQAVTAVTGLLQLVVAVLGRGLLAPTLLRPSGPGSARELVDQLFPDAYPVPADAARFRDRHGALMRAEVLAATRRVLERWHGAGTAVLDQRAVDDWVMVTGVAQFLFVERTKDVPPGQSEAAESAQQRTLAALRGEIMRAACPALTPELRPVFARYCTVPSTWSN
jgi:hypothetical protein